MKIVYHHRTQGKGVEGIHIREMAAALRREGHDITFVSPERAASPEAAGENAFAAISRYAPELLFEFAEIAYNFVAARRLSWQIAGKGCDLIYERYALLNWAGAHAARKYKVPFVLEVNYTSFTPLYRSRSLPLLPFAHAVDRRVFAAADVIAVVSSWLKEHLVRLGVPADKIIVTPNAADPVRFDPTISGEPVRRKYRLSGRTVIGFIGGFYPWHGLALLLEAFAVLRRETPGLALLLVGEGPEKRKLQQQVREQRLESDVIFAGPVPSSEAAACIAAFDVAVMPHSNEYGSPMKVYEYMAMGKPVVAPRLAPLEDALLNGREGFLFTPGDREELIAALRLLLADGLLRQRMGEEGRGNIEWRRNWRHNARAVMRQVDKVLEGRYCGKCGRLAEDRRRFIAIDLADFPPGIARTLYLFTTPGYLAVAVYRFGSWCVRGGGIIRRLARKVYFVLNRATELATGISINPFAEIGGGIYIGHHGGIFIHSNARIGRNCNISQGVTIGVKAPFETENAPRIGDGVYIGAGAKVLGGIRVGDRAVIGANAVVVHDLPAGAVAAGIPARVIRSRETASAVRGDQHEDTIYHSTGAFPAV